MSCVNGLLRPMKTTLLVMTTVILLIGGCRRSRPEPHQIFPFGFISTAGDNVLFMGDSVTMAAFDRHEDHLPGYNEVVQMLYPGHSPGYVDAGVGGTTSVAGLSSIDSLLEKYPWVNFVALCYGTNDASVFHESSLSIFKACMSAMVERVILSGRVPVIPTIPYSASVDLPDVPSFNAAISDINARYGLAAGPDLYSWFKSHQSELESDGIHPTVQGYRDINILWAMNLGNVAH